MCWLLNCYKTEWFELMDIFAWLLVGHLVGDWLFQNDWMATGKKQKFFSWAGVSHFVIYTMTVVFTIYLFGVGRYNPAFYLILGLLVFISHWIIDGTRIVDIWIQLYRQTDSVMMRVMVDQTLHILVLAVLAGLILS